MGHVLLLLLLALLLITSTHSTAGHAPAAITEAKQGAVESMMRAMHSTVGSRPPSCEGRCRSCVRCEAVQVPVTPQAVLLLQRKRRSSSGGSNVNGGGGSSGLGRTRTAALLTSSYDDHSNYKALSWRCKCGGMLLNP